MYIQERADSEEFLETRASLSPPCTRIHFCLFENVWPAPCAKMDSCFWRRCSQWIPVSRYMSVFWECVASSVPFVGLCAGLKLAGRSPAAPECPAESPAKKIARQTFKLGLPNSSQLAWAIFARPCYDWNNLFRWHQCLAVYVAVCVLGAVCCSVWRECVQAKNVEQTVCCRALQYVYHVQCVAVCSRISTRDNTLQQWLQNTTPPCNTPQHTCMLVRYSVGNRRSKFSQNKSVLSLLCRKTIWQTFQNVYLDTRVIEHAEQHAEILKK